jgi:hypothetical protein
MPATAPNWAEQTVAIATAVLGLGVVGAVAAAVFGAQQVREARRSRQAHVAAEFLRRWNEEPLVQSRRLVARFSTPEELASAFQRYIAADAHEAHFSTASSTTLSSSPRSSGAGPSTSP